MKEIYVAGRRIRLDPSMVLGEGGEAEVYNLSPAFPGTALKVWKPPNHPDYEGDDDEKKRNREGAALRLVEYGKKLKTFPRSMPPGVVAPREIATDRTRDHVLGYTMQLIEGAQVFKTLTQKDFRKQSGIDGNGVLRRFRKLHGVVNGVHLSPAVIGDFNYLNVLYKDEEVYLIDADSMQWGKYLTRSFTPRFLDPLLADPTLTHLVQARPHTVGGDWYSFSLMLFEGLLFLHPYGGIHDPKDARKQVPIDARPLKRISVFHPEVIYPKKAIPLDRLPDDVLQFYHLLLEKDARGEFPMKLLESLRWTTCLACGTEHARAHCPNCAKPAPDAVKTMVVRGRVKMERIFDTTGTIISATHRGGALQLLIHKDGTLQREDGSTLFSGPLAPGMVSRIHKNGAAVGLGSTLFVLNEGTSPQRLAVDTYRGTRPVFDTNSRHLYWVEQGRLLRDDTLGPKFIGNALTGQTLFWVGERFGFGFSRAGGYQAGFVFDADKSGIMDSVPIPQLTGKLVDATCFFSDRRCWFLVSLNDNGIIKNRCFVMSEDGRLVASAEAVEDDGSWLGEPRGKCAVDLGGGGKPSHHVLFSATDGGVVCLEEQSGAIYQTATFPDTSDFVDATDTLLTSPGGLVTVGRRSAKKLTIS